MSKSKDFNKKLIDSCVELLTKKFTDMEQDAFNTHARMAIRAEIKDMKILLAEKRTESAWDDHLSNDCGIKMDKSTSNDLRECR